MSKGSNNEETNLPGKGCTLYVVRVGNGSKTKDSAPCSKCAETIKKFGIKKIVYSMGDDSYNCVNAKDYQAKSVCSGVRWLSKE